MFRPGLLATLSALILTGCVSSYAYRDGDGGDYYYSEPEVEYYDVYGRPYGIIGYGYPGGWYAHFGYFYGPYYPHWRYGHRYGGYYGYPPYYDHHRYPPHHRPPQHRPPNMPPADGSDQPRPPRPPGTPPIARPPREDHDRENGPWRRPGDWPRGRVAPPQPAEPADTPPRGAEGPRRTPFTMSQPSQPGAQGGERMRRPPPPPRPEPVAPRPRMEPPAGRFEAPERESGRDPVP
jgi:hypothetical protein